MTKRTNIIGRVKRYFKGRDIELVVFVAVCIEYTIIIIKAVGL